MSELRNRIARDLRKVEQLAPDLHWQAMAAFTDRDFPGGLALNMLGPSANPELWEATYESAEAEVWNSDQPMTRFSDYASDQVLSEAHPVYVLEQWTRIIREEREQPTGLKATLSREADYLRKSLDWSTRTTIDGALEWPPVTEMATELHQLVRAMENALSEGDRLDASASACFKDDPLTKSGRCGGRLVRAMLKRQTCPHVELARQSASSLSQLLAHSPSLAKAHKSCDQGGRDDVYRCQKCEKMYTTAEYWLAVREHYELEAG